MSVGVHTFSPRMLVLIVGVVSCCEFGEVVAVSHSVVGYHGKLPNCFAEGLRFRGKEGCPPIPCECDLSKLSPEDPYDEIAYVHSGDTPMPGERGLVISRVHITVVVEPAITVDEVHAWIRLNLHGTIEGQYPSDSAYLIRIPIERMSSIDKMTKRLGMEPWIKSASRPTFPNPVLLQPELPSWMSRYPWRSLWWLPE